MIKDVMKMNDEQFKAAIELIEQFRIDLHEIVDQKIDTAIEGLKNGESLVVRNLESSLSTAPAVFKGKKASAVVFPNGESVSVSTWKSAVIAVLQYCDTDPTIHERLMGIRGKVLGRQRCLLAATPDGMDVPLQINEGLYLESKFDTESLIYVVTQRILDAVGYDYSGFRVQYQTDGSIRSEQVETLKTEQTMYG